jgi:bifunctional ADP-heptose synthase (sugar kinase/adenylyltransferase)
VITLGRRHVPDDQGPASASHVPTFAREVFDVTGAGDTVIAHLALYLAAGLRS